MYIFNRWLPMLFKEKKSSQYTSTGEYASLLSDVFWNSTEHTEKGRIQM